MKLPALLLALAAATCFGLAVADPINLADLQARAAKGDPEAELELGRAYHLGNGVARDFAKAADLYRKAAAQGNAKAMYNLGYLYHHAQGVTRDEKTAAEWFRKAADKGLPAAELEVGLAAFNGNNGETQDFKVAAKWLLLAGQQTQVPSELERAAGVLGYLYEHGDGLTLNGQEAVRWYTIAANLGNAKAMWNLGRIYDEGRIVKGDLVQSYMWLKVAAYQGEPLSMHLLSDYLAAKKYTAAQMAEGDRLAGDFQAKHSRQVRALSGPLPTVLDPETMELRQHAQAKSPPLTAPASAPSDAPATSSSAAMTPGP